MWFTMGCRKREREKERERETEGGRGREKDLEMQPRDVRVVVSQLRADATAIAELVSSRYPASRLGDAFRSVSILGPYSRMFNIKYDRVFVNSVATNISKEEWQKDFTCVES